MDSNRQQREYDKFEETVDGQTAVRTLSVSGLIPKEYDYIAVTYPTDTTETYTFKIGGSGGTTISAVTLTYTDDTKCYLSSVETA